MKHLEVISLCAVLTQVSTIEYYYMNDLCNQTLHASKDQIRLQLTCMSEPNMKCQLIIDTPGSKQMMLFFNSIDIEQTDACRYAFLEIDDGRSRDDPFIGGGKKCGQSKPEGVFTTTGPYLTLYFQSDESPDCSEFDMVITPYHTATTYKDNTSPVISSKDGKTTQVDIPVTTTINFGKSVMVTGNCHDDEYMCENHRCIDEDLTCSNTRQTANNPCGDWSDCPPILSEKNIIEIVAGCVGSSVIVAIAMAACRRRAFRRRPAAPVTSVNGYNQIGSEQPSAPSLISAEFSSDEYNQNGTEQHSSPPLISTSTSTYGSNQFTSAPCITPPPLYSEAISNTPPPTYYEAINSGSYQNY